jgi:putative membrane protein
MAMHPVVQSFIAGFPILMLHSSVTLAILAAGVFLYIKITPYDEISLIRNGNTAAAVSLSGAILGLAIPLAFSMASSISVLEILIWGLVTLLLQLIAYRLTDKMMRDLPARIVAGELGPAILLVSIKLAVAAVNAAAVTA